MKHGFVMRTALGDPGPADNPNNMAPQIQEVLSDLLDDAYISQLRAMTKDNSVLPSSRYGGKWNPLVAGADDHGTSHFCVVDADRNAVSVTSTVGLMCLVGFPSVHIRWLATAEC